MIRCNLSSAMLPPSDIGQAYSMAAILLAGGTKERDMVYPTPVLAPSTVGWDEGYWTGYQYSGGRDTKDEEMFE